MPLPPIQPDRNFRPRSLSEPPKVYTPVPEDERERAGTVIAQAMPMPTLTPEEGDALLDCINAWDRENGYRDIDRTQDCYAFTTALKANPPTVEHEGGQIIMRISGGIAPTLPPLLAEKRDAQGNVVEPAKIKFLFRLPTFDELHAGEPRPHFAEPPGERSGSEQKVAVSVAPQGNQPASGARPSESARASNLSVSTPRDSVRGSPSASPRESTQGSRSSLGARFSAGLSRLGSMLSPRGSRASNDSPSPHSPARPQSTTSQNVRLSGLQATPQRPTGMDYELASQILQQAVPAARGASFDPQRKHYDIILRKIDELRSGDATESGKILADIARLDSQTFRLDCLAELAKQVNGLAPPDEEKTYAAIAGQLRGMRHVRDTTAEYRLVYDALVFWTEDRARPAP